MPVGRQYKKFLWPSDFANICRNIFTKFKDRSNLYKNMKDAIRNLKS